jgi:adenosylhomocysteine nucleosidase
METVGLIAALSEEFKPFLKQLGKYEHGILGVFPCFRFRLFNLNCLLINSGMGLRRAMDATHALINEAKPQFLISFGIAGALQDDLQVGDVVVVSEAYLLDKRVPGDPQSLVSMPAAAFQAVSQAMQLRGANLYMGSTITTRGSQEVLLQPNEIVHPVVEMETAGIAKVASEWGIPLLGLRAISDTANEPLPFSIEEFTDEEVNLRMGKIIKTIIQLPRILPQFLQVRRNVKTATQNLAIAVVETLRQPFIPNAQNIAYTEGNS